MMIGPEPMTMTHWMSVRLGMSGLLPVGMRSANRSKRYAASCGPAAASGWYCTEKLVSSPVGVAQLEPLDDVVVEADVADGHLAELGRRGRPRAGASTAKPWLWAVTSTLPVVRSMTGWLMPRWPYFSL